jgi:tRNA nucleotidyltransferase/poly(A) polymerase
MTSPITPPNTPPNQSPKLEDLECYLVGGAVRDELLGRSVVDRDWVVVGSTPEQMESMGFIQVGRDFPVYLHPESHDEYALARTERKKGAGHRGFTVHADPGVTLIEDLGRRDLTVNAIAKNAAAELIDPHLGVDDIQARVLRHVSDAFAEDPLRVFRVARFAAQLQDFNVAPETLALMQSMAQSGELSTLSAERVWQELDKALTATAPQRFFEVLKDCQGLAAWLAEVDVDVGVDSGVDVEHLNFKTVDPAMRFAELPLDKAGFSSLAERLKAPNAYLQGALDRLSYAAILLDWRTVASAELNAAFVALKVMHGGERMAWLAQWLVLTEGVNLHGLAELGQGWCQIAMADPELSGRAYGEALQTARLAWLDAERGDRPD